MSAEDEMIKLYSGQILALTMEIPHTERLAHPDASVMKRSPLCGSTVTVDVKLKDGRIAEYGQDVKACALGQASAAVVGKVAIGLDRATVEKGRAQLEAMLKAGGPVPEAPFQGLAVLEPAKAYKNRHASILLTLTALSEAMAQAGA